MIIYKATNKINGKIYIGQTTQTLSRRISNHKSDALLKKINTRFASAIRNYGIENFEFEEIDSANTKEELNRKEKYWIKKYESNKSDIGYNETDGGIDADTYKNKSDYQKTIIKQKLSRTKKGKSNPNSCAIKCKNITTNEELCFETIEDCVKFFNEKHHAFVSSRINEKNKYLYKRKWVFARVNEEYTKLSVEKGNRKSKKINVLDINTNEEKIFESFASAERYFKVRNKSFSGKAYQKGNEFVVMNRYKINVLS